MPVVPDLTGRVADNVQFVLEVGVSQEALTHHGAVAAFHQ